MFDEAAQGIRPGARQGISAIILAASNALFADGHVSFLADDRRPVVSGPAHHRRKENSGPSLVKRTYQQASEVTHLLPSPAARPIHELRNLRAHSNRRHFALDHRWHWCLAAGLVFMCV